MSTASIAPKLLTAEEFYDWVHRPENIDRWFELVRGEVIELPAPGILHGVVCSNAAWMLGNHVWRRGKGYVASNGAGVILERHPDTVRGPDVAMYEDARAFAELPAKYGEIAPRLAVEVLSPSDRADWLTRKINDYLRNGVAMVWLIDPEARTVTVYRPDRGPRHLAADAELDGEEVLPGFRCRVAEFFLLPTEQPPQPQRRQAKPPRKRRRK